MKRFATTSNPGVLFNERLGMLEELMRALDLVTSAGREQVMDKMLIILRREALGLDAPIAAADLAFLSNAMTDLEHEAGRSAPMPSVFNRNVEVAMGALRRTVMVAHSPRPSAVAGCAGCDGAARRRRRRSPKIGNVLPSSASSARPEDVAWCTQRDAE